MKTQLQFAAFIVHFGLVFVHPYGQNGYQLWKPSTLGVKYNPVVRPIKSLQMGVLESQHIFNAMKDELLRAQNKNIQKRRNSFGENVVVKRETNNQSHNHSNLSNQNHSNLNLSNHSNQNRSNYCNLNQNQTAAATSSSESSESRRDSTDIDSSPQDWQEDWYDQAQCLIQQADAMMKEVDHLKEEQQVLLFQADQKIWASENMPNRRASAIREAEQLQLQADDKRQLMDEKKNEAQGLRLEADKLLESIRVGRM